MTIQSTVSEGETEELKFTQILINHTTEAAFCLGAKAQFLYVNDAFCCMSEYSREELLLMTLHDLDVDFSPQHWSEQWQYLKKNCAASTKQERSLIDESRYGAKGGRIFPLEISRTYAQYQGRELICAFVHTRSDLAENLISSFEFRVQQDVDPSSPCFAINSALR